MESVQSRKPNLKNEPVSRRRALVWVGGVGAALLIYFSLLTLLSNERLLDMGPARGTISYAPEQVRQVASFTGGSAYQTMAFSPDGMLFATVAQGGQIELRGDDGSPLRTIDGGGRLLNVFFSPDSKVLVASGADNQIRLWRVADGTALYPPLSGHQQPLKVVIISNDGQRVQSLSEDGKVVLWQLSDGRSIRVSSGRLPAGIGTAAFSEDGRLVAFSDPEQGIVIWSLEKDEVRNVIDHALAKSPFAALRFTHLGGLLAATDVAGNVQVFQATTGDLIHSLPRQGVGSDTSAALAGAFSADARVYGVGGDDGTIALWDVRSGKLRATLNGHRGRVVAIGFSDDGRSMASADSDGTLLLWRVEGE